MPLPRVLRHTSCLLSRPRFPVSSQVPCLTPGSRSRPRSPILPQVPVSSQVPCHTPGPLSRPRSPVSPQVPVSSQVPCLVPGPLSCPRSLSRSRSPVSPHLPCLTPPVSHPRSPSRPRSLSRPKSPIRPRSPVTPHVPCLAPGTGLGLAPRRAGVLTRPSPPPCPLLPAPRCLCSPAAPPEFTHVCVKALLFVWGLEIFCCELPPLGSSQVPPGSAASPIRPDHPGPQEAAAGSMGSWEQGPYGHRLLPSMFRGETRPGGASGLLGSHCECQSQDLVHRGPHQPPPSSCSGWGKTESYLEEAA